MSKPINILIMVHGMSPSNKPRSPFDLYEPFWQALVKNAPQLQEIFPIGYIGVEWGHELPETPPPDLSALRTDQKLMRSQNFLHSRVCWEAIQRDNDATNVKMAELTANKMDFPSFTPIIRQLIIGLRESVMIMGFGDVIFYCSQEGETLIRQVVYGQVLEKLDLYRDAKDVRLHLVGHSLGVTLCHDFLYGLFAPDHEPDFYQQGSTEDVNRFRWWRNKAQRGELVVGSLTSTASQIPLFAMRKPKIVEMLAAEQLLNARDIGILTQQTVKWKIFYDIDDILGFGTRRLYQPSPAIMEFQVDTSDHPGDAHNNYWQNPTVIAETAKLLLVNGC